MANFDFPIVAVGASAGGIEALKKLVQCLPGDIDAAFVILQHLSPDYESQLTSILENAGELHCTEADHEISIEPGRVYVLPPDKYLRIADHGLFVDAPDAPRGQRMPIDYFMRSLADSAGECAVGVVLSGTGSDGTLGLRAIKGAGGLTFAQSPETALYDGMPKAAIENNDADRVLSIEGIAEEIITLARRGDAKLPMTSDTPNRRILAPILSLIRARLGHDFGAYKSGTIGRRVQRRMTLLRMDGLDEYIRYLRENDDELRRLFDDLLINVTSFFRDEEVWTTLSRGVVEPMVSNAKEGETLRVWVPACASGEEAYTIAILFDEACAKRDGAIAWQIFATDLDNHAIEIGRDAIYPPSIAGDLTEERLKRYFGKTSNGSYRVRKDLREKVVFAHQNILVDPPFSKLDLISCRNLLIYLDSENQRRMMDTFRFSLKEGGILLLGTSESPGERTRNFETLDKSVRIYRRKPGSVAPTFARGRGAIGESEELLAPVRIDRRRTLGDKIRHRLLERYAPPGVVVDSSGTVVYFTGSIREFLDLPEGEPTNNLFNMLPGSLRRSAREIISELRRNKSEVVGRKGKFRSEKSHFVVCVEGMRLERDGTTDEQILLTFQKETEFEHPEIGDSDSDDTNVKLLENELTILREDLQTTVEELETSNEELKASHEEAVAANEELQSANEELETSREELQSLNEELITVNHQLEEKISEVETTTDDLKNLLTSTRLPVLFLNQDLEISNFTPTISTIVELRDGDIGRPFDQLALKVDDEEMQEDAKAVLKDLVPVEKQIESEEGQTFLRRIQPYRTTDERIGGVVLTFTDITDQAHTAKLLGQRERQARILATLASDALSGKAPDEYLHDVCQKLRTAMACDLVKVLRLDEEHETFTMVAGVGWDRAEIGVATVPNDTNSQAGFTLIQDGPVLVEDIEEEDRFSPPDLLLRHQVRSGISVMLRVDGKTWGVLGVHDRAESAFDLEDVAIMSAVADILSLALDQLHRAQELARDRMTQSLALRAADLGVWQFDPEEGCVTMDDRILEIFGLETPRSKPLADVTRYVHPEDIGRVMQSFERCLESGEPYDAEFRIRRPDGKTAWLSGRGERIKIGERSAILGVNSDVTTRREREEQSLFIMRELDHRVKNLLAIILSIAQITSNSAKDLPSFVDGFTARLNAMSRTHGLLAGQRWNGTSLRRLIEEEVLNHVGPEQVVMTGPATSVSPAAAQSFGMLFHELTTNALKYGAFSIPGGTVEIRWDIETGEHDMLRLEWTERGGPKVKSPTRTGFGTKVIKRVVGSQLGAETELTWNPEGLVLALRADLSAIQPIREGTDGQREVTIETASRDSVRGKNVLVLDDEWLIAERHSMALTQAGATVVGPFVDLEQAMAEPVDDLHCAVLDYSLSKGQTVEPLIQRLSAAGIPIVIVSGFGKDVSLPTREEDWVIVPKPASDDAIVGHAAVAIERQNGASE